MINVASVMEIYNKVMRSAPPISRYVPGYVHYFGFLYYAMKDLGLKVALECGVWSGTATEHMIMSSNDTFVIGIDRAFQPEYLQVYDRHPNNVVFICGNTLDDETVEKVRDTLNGRTIDLLFLDSTHDGITPRKEFDLYYQFLSDVALVCCDDVSLGEDMKKFWLGLPGDKIQFDRLHMIDPVTTAGYGVAIVKKQM